MAPVRVEERERAEARAEPDPDRRGAGAAGGSPRRAPASNAPRPSRSRFGRPARSAPHGAAAAARDRSERAECSTYSGPSWATSSGLRSVASGCAQISAGSSALRMRLAIVTAFGLADRLRRRPTRAARSRAPPTRTCSPTGPDARFGFSGSRIHSLRPFAVDQLELVLEARDVGGGARQLPGTAVPGQLVRQPLAQLVGEADGGEATARIGDVEAELDHGSVSSVWKFARRTVLSGRVRAVSDTRQRPAAAAITTPPSSRGGTMTTRIRRLTVARRRARCESRSRSRSAVRRPGSTRRSTTA